MALDYESLQSVLLIESEVFEFSPELCQTLISSCLKTNSEKFGSHDPGCLMLIGYGFDVVISQDEIVKRLGKVNFRVFAEVPFIAGKPTDNNVSFAEIFPQGEKILLDSQGRPIKPRRIGF